MPRHTRPHRPTSQLARPLQSVDFLHNRQAVIDRSTELLDGVQREWIGMGRTAAWIKLPDFGAAARTAAARGVALKVVVFYEGDADTHAQTWRSIGAEVQFFEHGFIRLLIFDDNHAIIAFPKVVTSLLEDREYFGYHVHDEQSVSDLRSYFLQIWEQAEPYPAIDPTLEERHIVFASGLVRFIERVIERAAIGS